MSSKSTDEKSATSHEAPSSSLQSEAATAPESAWFFAWSKSAMLYLAAVTTYLGAVIGLVAAWKKFIADKGDKADLTIYMLAGVLALPLLFALFFNLLPALRRRRERSLRPRTDAKQKADSSYFQTSPRQDDSHGFFSNGYEPFLEWALAPRAPLLHLTGLSGSGKSSLISAYLKPHLEDPAPGDRTILLIVRSYHDPLVSLKEALLAQWKKKPSDYETLSPLEALQRAARQRDGEDRLLVAFDQFEEFFLLRANLSSEGETADGTTAAVARAEIEPLRDFLRTFLADPPARVTLLLSYREDHRRLLAPLELPPRQERINWMTVDPFDFAAATRFLRACPGLTIPEARMDRVLREAARQEGGRVVMRPIVANLLGLVLRQMAGHPTLWRRKGDLLRGYVRDSLGVELTEERARLLRALLTDFHTARPRSVADIARDSRWDAATLDAQLDHFGRAGLLRCLNPEQRDPERRVWQIAHDFLATLIERVLDGMHRTLWRALRPWLAPAAVFLALGVFLIMPWVERHRDISSLANAGFTWNEAKSEIVVGTSEGRGITNLDSFSDLLHRMKPRSLDLHSCQALQNVDGLKGLTSLQSLNVSNCYDLQNVDGLKGLTSLKYLDLSDGRELKSLNGLKGLTSLQSLNLDRGVALENVDDLKDLTSLEYLNLGECGPLPNADVLKGLTSLRNLNLFKCPNLDDVDGLKGLTSLQSLNLSACVWLKHLDGLKRLTSLQSLSVRACRELQNVDGLRGLTSLQYLALTWCDALPDADVLKGLTSLKNLDLSGSHELQNVDGLRGLTSLKYLDLSWCKKLENVDGLKGLTSLQYLDLRECVSLPKKSWPDLISALSTTRISLPDGSVSGPRP